jgi:nucleotide-binding universal stress UspA family protein
MEKKLLLAIDGSKNSLIALDYVSHLFHGCPEIKITLFHVLPPIPPIYKDGELGDPFVQKHLADWKKKNQESIEKVLLRAKEKMIKTGWPESQITIRAQEKRLGQARDILFEAEKGLYDAIIVGRRGLSKWEEVFLGSVSNKIVQGAKSIPVWVIGGKITSHRMLVALDGSENALRAVDHLSFILSSCKNSETRILLLNIWPGWINASGPKIIPHLSAREEYEKKTDSFMSQAEEMILESELPPEQVGRKVNLKAVDITKAILAEAQKGDYGTIVVGRRGISKAKEFFMGSVSNKILQQAADKAIWIIG